jgi:hypothetical protein
MRISIAAKYFGILLVFFSKNIVTSAIYVPCGNEPGVGLVDPDSFGDPKTEECRKCKVDGCLFWCGHGLPVMTTFHYIET